MITRVDEDKMFELLETANIKEHVIDAGFELYDLMLNNDRVVLIKGPQEGANYQIQLT
jgi:hypothetical protein